MRKRTFFQYRRGLFEGQDADFQASGACVGHAGDMKREMLVAWVKEKGQRWLGRKSMGSESQVQEPLCPLAGT